MRHHALCERAKARTTAEQLMGAWGKFPVRSVARVHRVVPLRASRPRSRGACHVTPFEGLGPNNKQLSLRSTGETCEEVRSTLPAWAYEGIEQCRAPANHESTLEER